MRATSLLAGCNPVPRPNTATMRAAVFVLILPLLAAQAQTGGTPVVGARDPVYARDGRLALSVRGDLWIIGATGEWRRITSGPAWDHTPSWSKAGTSLVFSSNRA